LPRAKRKTEQIPIDPTELSEFWREQSGVHFQAYSKLRSIAVAKLTEYQEAIDDGVIEPGDINTFDLGTIARCLDIAVKGEREALSMQYQDHNRAIKTVEQLGFLVVEKRVDETGKEVMTIAVDAQHIQD